VPNDGNATRPTVGEATQPVIEREALLLSAADALELGARLWAMAYPEHTRELRDIGRREGRPVATSDRQFLAVAEQAWLNATGL
jgi:hypothetical protein